MAAKRGRPPLPPEAGKRFPLNMRTTKEVRDKLRAAALDSGRSLAQEVEYRLERSFREDPLIPAVADLWDAVVSLKVLQEDLAKLPSWRRTKGG